MEVLTELGLLVQEGFYTTIICMFLFWFIPIERIKTLWVYEVAMRLIVAYVAFAMVWLSTQTPIYEWDNTIIKKAFITLAFSSLFYEFAGKFIVKKWLQNYKVDKTKMI